MNDAIAPGPLEIRRRLVANDVSGLTNEEREIAITSWDAALQAARFAGRALPILDRMRAQQAALLVVDMQQAFLSPGAAIEVPAGREIIPNINRLAAAVRAGGGLIVFFRYNAAANVGLLSHFERLSYLGPERESPLNALRPSHEQFELHPELVVMKTDTVLDKNRYAAPLGSSIMKLLEVRGIQQCLVTGVTTDVCVGNTAEVLMQLDMRTVVLWDGCAALNRLVHELYLGRIFGLYADVMLTDEATARLT